MPSPIEERVNKFGVLLLIGGCLLVTKEWYPWGDSNARTWLRRPALYPLSYRGAFPGTDYWRD